jgi:hypothetical protein
VSQRGHPRSGSATIEFYVSVLGFVVDSNGGLRGTNAHLAFTTDPQNWYPEPDLSDQLWIDVDDVSTLHARVVGKVQVESGPDVYDHGRRELNQGL